MKRLWPVAVLALLVSAPALAQTPWIHVEVDEGGDDASHVKVNLPVSVVEIALEAAPDEIVDDGEIHLAHIDEELDIEDMRRLWDELRETGDAEFVSVEEDEKTVKVRRTGELIVVDIEDRRDGRDDGRIEVPVSVVDALFSGDGNDLNIGAALAELRTQRGDIVRVTDGETRVRVWIDESN